LILFYFILFFHLLSIVISDKWIDDKGKPGANSNTKLSEGDFDVIYDESIILNKKKEQLLKKNTNSNPFGLRNSIK